jgi:Zn-dependent protease
MVLPNLIELFGIILVLVLAMTFHEVGHAYVARWFGDDTAFEAGRISFNPLRHIDPLGSVLLPLICLMTGGFLFGWAKPVPINVGRMRNPHRAIIYVAIAGPVMNVVLAIISCILVYLTAFLASPTLHHILLISFQLNMMFAIFNMLPIPPLDGSKILQQMLPWSVSMYHKWAFYEKYGFFILIGILFIVPALFGVSPIKWIVFDPIVWMTHALFP